VCLEGSIEIHILMIEFHATPHWEEVKATVLPSSRKSSKLWFKSGGKCAYLPVGSFSFQ
jgi:hypothetical protein